MSFRAVEVTIGTAAIAIATATEKNTHEITLGNDYNKVIYVGGAAVAIGGGYSIHKNVPVTLKIANGDILYAISSTASTDLHIYDFQVDP
jgi:hypothetical protein